MKRTYNRAIGSLTILLVLLLALVLIPPMLVLTVSAEETEEEFPGGTCGDNLTWELKDGILTISGTGSMWDYNARSGYNPSWDWYLDSMIGVVIEEGVTSIGDDTFYSNGDIVYLSLPASLTSIGNEAFAYTPVHHIFYAGSEEQWQEIRKSNVSYNSQWSKALRHDNVTDFHVDLDTTCRHYVGYCDLCADGFLAEELGSDHNFANGACTACGLAEYVRYSMSEQGKVTVHGVEGDLTEVEIPGYIEGCPVVIGNEAFQDSELESITLGEGIKAIGTHSFTLCSNLTEIDLPSTLKTIGYGAFWGCKNLMRISVPAGLELVDSYAFYGCDSLYRVDITDLSAWFEIAFTPYYEITGEHSGNPLEYAEWLYLNGEKITDLVIPEGVSAISDCAFYGYKGLNSVTVPASVTSIGLHAFQGCDNLESVHITDLAAWCSIQYESVWNGMYHQPSNPLQFADGLYLNGELITDLVLPEEITEVSGYAFCEYDALKSVTVPEHITFIGSLAFYNCENLETVTLLGNQAALNGSTFAQCGKLTEINGPGAFADIGYRAFYCDGKLRNLPLSDHCTIVRTEALYSCGSLTYVDLPDSVATLEQDSLRSSAVVAVTIGTGVEKIMDNAFASTNLCHVYYRGDEAAWSEIMIYNGNDLLEDAVLHYGATGDGIIVEGDCLHEEWTCHICNELFVTLNFRNGSHEYTAEVIAPTCTEDGYTTYTCHCGDTYTADETPALGHSFGNWYVTREATEDAEGEEKRECSRCDESEIRAIPKLDHVHNYDSVVTEPTCTEGGYTTYTCRCGDSYTADETAALGHDFENGKCTRCDAEDPDYAPGNPFTDVPEDSWYAGPVLWAMRKGITAGVSATSFAPDQTCTRAQVVTFLWRAFGQPEPTRTENPFTDVAEGVYYYDAVLWAVENGITSGATATTFTPDKPCTRDQVVTFLWRAMGKPTPEKQDNPFTDVPAECYYYQPVLWAVENGITSGMSATTFAPSNPCTRAQVVTFLYRALKDK